MFQGVGYNLGATTQLHVQLHFHPSFNFQLVSICKDLERSSTTAVLEWASFFPICSVDILWNLVRSIQTLLRNTKHASCSSLVLLDKWKVSKSLILILWQILCCGFIRCMKRSAMFLSTEAQSLIEPHTCFRVSPNIGLQGLGSGEA